MAVESRRYNNRAVQVPEKRMWSYCQGTNRVMENPREWAKLSDGHMKGGISDPHEGLCRVQGYGYGSVGAGLMRLEERIVLDGSGLGACVTGHDGDDGIVDPVYTDGADTNSGGASVDVDHILIISDQLDVAEQIAAASLEDVLVVMHSVDRDDSSSLLSDLRRMLGNDRVDQIGIATHGYTGGGGFMLGHEAVDSELLTQPVMSRFWCGLSSLLEPGGRIDILACEVTATSEGESLIAELESLTGVDFAASDDMTGSPGSGGDWILESDAVDAGALYFDTSMLDGIDLLLANTPASLSYPSTQQSVASGGSVTFTGGTQISISDPDSSPSVTLTTNHGVLSLSQLTGLSFTSGDGSADTTMTFSGPVSSINAALDGLVLDLSVEPAFSNLATILLTADDGAGPADYGCVDVLVGGGLNTSPVLSAGIYSMDTIGEDAWPNTGTLVSDVIGSLGGNPFTDADALAGEELEGIAITDLNGELYGSWEYSLDGGTSWDSIDAVTGNHSLLLSALPDVRVRFVPDSHQNDVTMPFPNNPYFQFRGWDQSSGVNGSYADVTVNGGNTAYSGVQRGAQISVTQLNDTPSVLMPSDQTTTTADDVIILPAIMVDDADDFEDSINGNLELSLSLSLDGGHGVLTLASVAGLTNVTGNGSATISFRGVLDDVNTALAGVRFDASDGWFGTETLSVGLNDLGNTGGGGVKSTTGSMTLTVNDVTPAVPTDPVEPVQEDEDPSYDNAPSGPVPVESSDIPPDEGDMSFDIDLGALFGEDGVSDVGTDQSVLSEVSSGVSAGGPGYEEELDEWQVTGIDEATALQITRELVLGQELFGADQAEEIRMAYDQIITLYAHSPEEMARHLLSAFKAVVESASTYKHALTVIESAKHEISLSTQTNESVINEVKLLLSDVYENQYDIRTATGRLESAVVTAAQGGEQMFDRFAEDAITAALTRLDRENAELILAFRSLDASVRVARDIRVEGPVENALKLLEETVTAAREHARDEISRIRAQWDQAAEDLLASCLQVLVRRK